MDQPTQQPQLPKPSSPRRSLIVPAGVMLLCAGLVWLFSGRPEPTAPQAEKDAQEAPQAPFIAQNEVDAEPLTPPSPAPATSPVLVVDPPKPEGTAVPAPPAPAPANPEVAATDPAPDPAPAAPPTPVEGKMEEGKTEPAPSTDVAATAPTEMAPGSPPLTPIQSPEEVAATAEAAAKATHQENFVGPPVELAGTVAPSEAEAKDISAKIAGEPRTPAPMPAPADAGMKEGEAPPATPENAKDVTASKAEKKHAIEGHGDDELDPEEIEEAKTKKAAPTEKATAARKSKQDMPGWELLSYQERDYVTAESIHRFYRFANVSFDGKNVWFRSPVLIMKGRVGSQDLLINDIKFVMSYPIVNLNGKACFSRLDLCKLIDPVLRPSYISTASSFDTVIIDPGHGGHDTGAKGVYGYEKDFALKLAFALKGVLERQGLKVIMTRTTDTFISLGGRVAFANKIPNSIYVSLHYNSGPSTATGIETFALTPQGGSSIYGARSHDYNAFQGNNRDSENIALATAVHASVISRFKFVDRGVKRARWAVLKGLQRPGILFEGGFVTNSSDGRFIAADNFRTEMANTIGQAILNYRRALQPRKSGR